MSSDSARAAMNKDFPNLNARLILRIWNISVQCSIAFPMATDAAAESTQLVLRNNSGLSAIPVVASAVVFKSVAISSRVAINSAQDCSRADMASYSFFLFRKA